jgi:general stress protein 13
MSVEVGQVLKGKVTGIQSFGAFVALEGEAGTQGLVHISEVSNTYVKDINEFLTVGQEVEVKVIKLDEASKKISLSIRALLPSEKEPEPLPEGESAEELVYEVSETGEASGVLPEEDAPAAEEAPAAEDTPEA